MGPLAAFSGGPGAPFIQNQGQWDGDFEFKASFGTLTVFAEAEGFTFLKQKEIVHDHEHAHEGDHHPLPETIWNHAFRLRLLGANDAQFHGFDIKDAYHNYLIGNDRTKWKGHVPLYGGIEAKDVYAGIDIKVYGDGNAFKYDYIVDPGADPNQIRFNYVGADKVVFDGQRILIRTAVGELVESIPLSYQMIEGVRVPVACEYSPGNQGFGFYFPEGYDANYQLIIDPVLVAATLSGTGSGGSNFGHGAAFDFAGNIYTHAISFNSDYPTSDGAFQTAYGGGNTDAAISKLTADGSDLIFATFLGGSGFEYPHSTITNANQEVFIFGITASTNFPVAANAFQSEYGGGGEDIFVTGLSADGSQLVGSTYLGGEAGDGRNIVGFGYENYRGEININFDGEIFISSCSSSSDFPVTSGVAQETKNSGQDGVVVKLSPNLSDLVWSTFIGSAVDDMAYGIRVKDDQTVMVCGAVGGTLNGGNGSGFPTTSGAYQETFAGGDNDAFVTQFSADGSTILNSTLVGLPNADRAYFLDIDSEENVWIYMQTSSPWQITDGAWGDGGGNLVVHKLNSDLSELLITSFLSDQNGANGQPVAFMVDLCNGVYTSAFSVTGSFTASEDALFETGGFYIGVYEPDMSGLIYGTYYTENHVDGGTSRFDKQGIVYQGVCSGGSFSTSDDAWATDQETGWDIGVFKIDFEIQSVNAVAGAAGFLTGCAPHNVVFQNFSSGESIAWDFGDGTTSDELEPTHLYTEAGEYLVTMVVSDPESCNLTDTAFISITVLPEVEFFAGFEYTFDCETGTVVITDQSSGPADIVYEWDMGDGTVLFDQNPVHTFGQPGTYTISLSLSSAACNQSMVEEQELVYIPFVSAEYEATVVDFCEDFTVAFFDFSENGDVWNWDMGDGTTLNQSGDFEYEYQESGTYQVQLILENAGTCNLADTFDLEIVINEPPTLNPEISITQTGFCADLTYFASVEPNGPAGSFIWTLNGEEAGTESTLETSVEDPGPYLVEVTVFDAVCNAPFPASVPFDFYEELGFELPPVLYLCYYEESLLLDATVAFESATYSWNGGVSDEALLTVTEAGNYEVTVGFNGCIEVQDTDVNFGAEFPLAFDAIICQGQSNLIQFIDFPAIESVFWDNGQTGFTVDISEGGYHPFRAVDVIGCDQIDSLLAIPRPEDPNLQIPNIFTPNGDGKNDVFQIVGDSLSYYDLEIYDRWGRMIFKTNEIYGSWDGSTDGIGDTPNDGALMYILKYRDLCDRENRVSTGNIAIVR